MIIVFLLFGLANLIARIRVKNFLKSQDPIWENYEYSFFRGLSLLMIVSGVVFSLILQSYTSPEWAKTMTTEEINLTRSYLIRLVTDIHVGLALFMHILDLAISWYKVSDKYVKTFDI